MLKTCDLALAKSKEACVLVFYSHHRPHLAHRDMVFFAKAREQGWTCEEILSRRFTVRPTFYTSRLRMGPNS